MGVTHGCLGLGLMLTGVLPTWANEVGSIPDRENRTLEQYAVANKTCDEWTDGCAVCLRHGDGTFGCSLPGIACQPAGLACRTWTKGKDAH